MILPDGSQLTYCSNIHPGESWPQVRDNLERYVTRVRAAVSPSAPFGIGLRLSGRAAMELAEPAAFEEFSAFLERERMYVFTLNGFPYGPFHGTRVKEDVYLPDWRDDERQRYTDLLSDLLAQLLPEGMAGSISTVPGAYKSVVRGAEDRARMVDSLLRSVAHLIEVERRTGKFIALALEPEPCCFLETVDECVAFFRDAVRTPESVQQLARYARLETGPARQAIERHLGICLDLCHAAVEFEDPAHCMERLRAAGIAVPKVQISSGLRLPALTAEALAALRPYQDPVYLHQVVERGPDGLRRFNDLADAFASLAEDPRQAEWRVHFHVPLFLETLPRFSTTQPFIREMLAQHRRAPLSAHLEVETYTWDVLPAELRNQAVENAVARELIWVLEELAVPATRSLGAAA